MKQPVKSGLPAPSAPIEWATVADGILYTAQIPLKADGTIEAGDIKTQTRLTLDNLKRTVSAAGGSMADVAQVLVYLPEPSDCLKGVRGAGGGRARHDRRRQLLQRVGGEAVRLRSEGWIADRIVKAERIELCRKVTESADRFGEIKGSNSCLKIAG